ncbi:MAG TPA: hypothetical protein VH479_12245, partial [Acidimicrobiales bacterium]
FYDRQYGDDNTTGFSDITLSTSVDLTSFSSTRVTSGSMPPPTQFTGQFMGDYIMVDATDKVAYPAWSDTRAPALFLCPGTGTEGSPPELCQAPAANAAVANDQEIFIAGVRVHNR